MAVHATHNAPIYLTADVRAIETAAASSSPPLMERAGLAAADVAREVAGGNGRPVLVLAGPGNNGGDAFVLARHLKQWYFKVTVVFAGEEGKLFGSITGQDVAEALAAQGHAVDRRKLELDHPIKTVGEHTVRIRLHPEVHADVRVTVVAE